MIAIVREVVDFTRTVGLEFISFYNIKYLKEILDRSLS